MTSRERRRSGFGSIPAEAHKYELYLGLYELWCDYLRDVLRLQPTDTGTPNLRDNANCERLLKADYHGALVNVTKSKCPSYVGVRGIVVKETRNTFVVCCRDDRCRTVPKECSVFEFELAGQSRSQQPPVRWEIFGEHFGYRAADRAGRKFKGKGTIELG